MVDQDKSPTDNSPQISAGLVVGEAALILRCREQKTEAAFSTKDTYLGDKPVTVRFRIDSQDPIKEAWRPSMNGLAAFAPKPEEFIRALPDSGKVFIRALKLLPARTKTQTSYYPVYPKSERR